MNGDRNEQATHTERELTLDEIERQLDANAVARDNLLVKARQRQEAAAKEQEFAAALIRRFSVTDSSTTSPGY